MKQSKSLTLFLIAIILSGCVNKNIDKENLKNLKDVNLEITNDNNVVLKKKYTNNEKNNTDKNINKQNKQFEKIPNFEKKYSKDIQIQGKKEAEVKLTGNDIKISVENIPLGEFVDMFFSNIAKLNYTVTKEVRDNKAPITLNMATKQPVSDVYEIVKKLLSMNGVSVKKEKNIFLIEKGTKADIDLSTDMYIGYGREVPENISDDEMIMMFVPYYYINPKKSTYILKESGIPTKRYYYPVKNVQLIKNTAGVVRKSLDIIKLIDRPYIEGKTPYLVSFDNIEVDDFYKTIRTIFKSNGIDVSSIPTDSGILLNTIKDINSLLVITPKESWFDMVLYWKEKLDIRSEMNLEPHFYTYKVKNRKADELADAINSVIEIKLTSKNEKSEEKTNDKKSNIKELENNKKTDYKVTADLPTNTLMMQLLPTEYREILPLIEELDALPLQVLAEVTLAEVTLTDTFNLGFEHAIRNNKALEANPFSLANGVVTASIGGSGFGAVYQSANINTVIDAYAEKKLLNILSKPKLLILNNESGNINVGQQVPVLTSESNSDNLEAVTRAVQYRSTGVTVNLTPTINSNGILTMKISISLSEAQLNGTSSIDSPLIVNRALATTLTIQDDETVLLGGLISNNESRSNKGVPLLKDIPFMGSLFEYESKQNTKTELIMLIKPKIITKKLQLLEQTRKYKALMKILNKYSLF